MEQTTERIWEVFGEQLRGYISRRISDSSSIDDILQDVFVKIHSNIETLDDETKIRSWVYQITRNTIIDYYRRRKIIHEDIETVHVAEEPDEETPAQEIASGLRTIVESLPEKYAEALLFVEFQGMSQIELAKKLGISLSGAKSRVQRARSMVRDSLMNCCHFQFDRYGTIIDSVPVCCCCCPSSSKK